MKSEYITHHEMVCTFVHPSDVNLKTNNCTFVCFLRIFLKSEIDFKYVLLFVLFWGALDFLLLLLCLLLYIPGVFIFVSLLIWKMLSVPNVFPARLVEVVQEHLEGSRLDGSLSNYFCPLKLTSLHPEGIF